MQVPTHEENQVTETEVYCPSCNDKHRARTGTLDETGWPIVEWLEPHTPTPTTPPESPEMAEARDELARHAGEAMSIALDVGSFDMIEEVLEEALGGSPAPAEPPEDPEDG
jgi:hypothetical protein